MMYDNINSNKKVERFEPSSQFKVVISQKSYGLKLVAVAFQTLPARLESWKSLES